MDGESESYDLLEHDEDKYPFIKVFVSSGQRKEAFQLIGLNILLRVSHKFFKENYCPLSKTKKLFIFLSGEAVKMSDIEEDYEGDQDTHVLGLTSVDVFEHCKLGRITLYFNHNQDKTQILRTLLHELDHALWRFNGDSFSWDKSYWDRPHEVRARYRSDAWINILKKEDKELHEEIDKLQDRLSKLRHFRVSQSVGITIGINLIDREIIKIRRKMLTLSGDCLFSCPPFWLSN